MKQIAASLAGFLRDERGATAIEYVFIASLVSIVAAAVLTSIGVRVSELLAGVIPGLEPR